MLSRVRYDEEEGVVDEYKDVRTQSYSKLLVKREILCLAVLIGSFTRASVLTIATPIEVTT